MDKQEGLTHFWPMFPFYTLKTPENLFRRYKMGKLARSGLIFHFLTVPAPISFLSISSPRHCEQMTRKNCERCINSSTFEDQQATIQGNILI